jgi:hypothetical protein
VDTEGIPMAYGVMNDIKPPIEQFYEGADAVMSGAHVHLKTRTRPHNISYITTFKINIFFVLEATARLEEYYSIRITSAVPKYLPRIIQDDTVFSEHYEKLYDTSIKDLKDLCGESDGATILIWYKYIKSRGIVPCSSGKMGGNKRKHRMGSSSTPSSSSSPGMR